MLPLSCRIARTERVSRGSPRGADAEGALDTLERPAC